MLSPQFLLPVHTELVVDLFAGGGGASTGAVDDVAVVRGLGATDYGMNTIIYTYSEEIDGDDLDAAIDAAIAAKDKLD